MKTISEIQREFFQKYNMICEGWNASHLITEDRASKNQHKARNLAKKRGCNDVEAQRVVMSIRHDIPNVELRDCKFLVGVTRIYLDGQLYSAGIMSELDGYLKIIASDEHVNEYDENLNGMSFEEIKNRFSGIARGLLDAEKEELSGMQFEENGDYEIVKIDSQRDASRYAPYCNWCITTSEQNYNNYTCNGINQIYFCLRKGFKNESRVYGDDFPLDSYGLSMMSIIVRPDGSIAYGTTRWNHAKHNGIEASDQSLSDTKFISRLIGRNFYDTFKPNTKFKDALDNAMARLANGEAPENVFDKCDVIGEGWKSVCLFKMISLITPEGKLFKDGQLWFIYVVCFYEGFAQVQRDDGMWSFIDARTCDLIKGGQLWFKNVGEFHEGFAEVQRNDRKVSFIDGNGDFIKGGQLWFKDASWFSEGFAPVQRDDGKWSFIDAKTRDLIKDGQLWFKENSDFYEGFAIVQRDDCKYSFIDRNGDFIKGGQLWFKNAYSFREGFAGVQRNDYMWSFIDARNGDFIKGGKLWFENVYDFEDGFARVQGDDGMSFIDARTGDLIKGGRLWFEEVYDFQDGYARVQRDDWKYSFIDARTCDLIKGGKLWFKDSSDFYEGFAEVQRDDEKWSFIDARTGDLIKGGKLWFENVFNFYEGFAEVQRDDGKYSFIDARTGDLIKDGQLWFNSSSSFYHGFAKVMCNDGNWYKLDKEGNLHEDNW